MSQIGKFTIMFLTITLVLEFLGIPTGLSTTAAYFGFNINANTAALDSYAMETSGFYGAIFGITGILVIAGITGAILVGFFTKTFDTSLVVLPLLVTLAAFLLSTTTAVILYTQGLNASWLTRIVVIIFGGLGIAFLWACIDYFRTG